MTGYNTGTAVGSSAPATSKTLTIPAGVLAKDGMVLLVHAFREDSGTTAIQVSSTGSGWTQIGTTQRSTSGSFVTDAAIFKCVASGSDPSAVITVSGTGSPSVYWDLVLVSYTGYSVIDVSGSAASLTCPSETTSINGDWAVYFIATSSSSANTLSGATVRQDIHTSSVDAAIADSNGSVGASGTSIGGGTWAHGASIFASFTVGLAPSPDASVSATAINATSSIPLPPLIGGGLPHITGLTGSGLLSHFVDQYGNPRLLLFDEPWALPTNAGRWGGTYESVMDAFTAARSSQGHTAFVVLPWGDTQVGGVYNDGRTYDGVYPFLLNGTPGTITTGTETVTLNDTFWQRIDYLVSSALYKGLTVIPNLFVGAYDQSASDAIFHNLTTTQAQAIGTAIATRYASYPNIIWLIGDDDYGSQDTLFSAMLTGIRSTGDTRPISNEYHTEMTSRAEMDPAQTIGTFGLASANFEWVYSYNMTYYGVEFAYGSAAEFSIPEIPVIWGDGWYWGMWSGGTQAQQNQTTRIMTFGALASGARGVNNTDLYTWQWPTGAAAAVTSDSWWANSMPLAIRTFWEALPNWYKLIPVPGSSIITSGRGTKASVMPSGGTGEVTSAAPSDTYVCMSQTADQSLNVFYCASAFSITIDQSKIMNGGAYTATFVDPSSPTVTHSATPGSTYSSSGLGNNAAGNPDWLLVLQGTISNAAVTPTVVAATASIPSPKNVPARVAATVSIPAPSVSASCLVTPTAVAAASSIPTPSVSAGNVASVVASAVMASTSIPVPTVLFGTTATPAVVSGHVTIPVSVVVTSSVVLATAVSATASIPAPTVTTIQIITPSTVQATVSIPIPVLSAISDVHITPLAISATASIPLPVNGVSVAITPNAVDAASTINGVSITTTALVVIDSLTGQVTVFLPFVARQFTFGSASVSSGVTAHSSISSLGA